MPPDPKVHVAVVAVIQRGNDLLLLQRGNYNADGYGKWSFPGGWLEHGEDPAFTAYREVEEETGIIVHPLREDGFCVRTSENGERHVVTLIIICEYLGGEPVNLEPNKALRVGWVPMEHLIELDLFETLEHWWWRSRDRKEVL